MKNWKQSRLLASMSPFRPPTLTGEALDTKRGARLLSFAKTLLPPSHNFYYTYSTIIKKAHMPINLESMV